MYFICVSAECWMLNAECLHYVQSAHILIIEYTKAEYGKALSNFCSLILVADILGTSFMHVSHLWLPPKLNTIPIQTTAHNSISALAFTIIYVFKSMKNHKTHNTKSIERRFKRIENYGSEGKIDENSVCVYCWNVFVVKWICSFSCYLFYSFGLGVNNRNTKIK